MQNKGVGANSVQLSFMGAELLSLWFQNLLLWQRGRQGGNLNDTIG